MPKNNIIYYRVELRTLTINISIIIYLLVCILLIQFILKGILS